MSHELELVVEDLQKVLDQFKTTFPNSWHSVWNTNGDFTVVPILAALVHGYAELEKQKSIVFEQHVDGEKVERLYEEALAKVKGVYSRDYGTESGHALNCPANKSDQAVCYCK